MSSDLYVTRLYWDGRRGIAKTADAEVKLSEPPLLNIPARFDEIDYAPEVEVAQLRDRFGKWRDMHHEEIEAAKRFLEGL
jgi:hypothetical protein